VRGYSIAALLVDQQSTTGLCRILSRTVRFGDIPLGSCCGRSFHDLRVEFPRGLGVIQVCAQAVASDDRIHRFRFDPIALCSDSLIVQFHETPATDFGADPRTGMGELLGYLFDTDYTGVARVHSRSDTRSALVSPSSQTDVNISFG
jgi:hypothetical protein